MPANRDNAGRFIKGKSGNPSGRKKTPEAFKRLVEEKSIPALMRVIEIIENPDSKPCDIYNCAKLILEYAYGKPQQSVSNTLTMGNLGDFVLKIRNAD